MREFVLVFCLTLFSGSIVMADEYGNGDYSSSGSYYDTYTGIASGNGYENRTGSSSYDSPYNRGIYYGRDYDRNSFGDYRPNADPDNRKPGCLTGSALSHCR